MPQRAANKQYARFVEGLHTEVTPLNYPEESVVDIANFDLKIDGSLRRRKGLEAEASAETNALHATYDNDNDAVTSHFWRNTGGLDQSFQIVQMGQVLYFFVDDEDTLTIRTDNIDITTFRVGGSSTTDAQIAAEPVDISWGRGQALVTQRYLEPFFLEYDPDADLVRACRISLKIRDFVGIEDGTVAQNEPSTLTDQHSYNLQNAGWSLTDINQYNTDKSRYPGRRQTWWRGYIRAETSGLTQDPRGVSSFSSDRMEAEPFGNAPAKNGRFLQDPFDTTANGGSGEIENVTWSFVDNGSTWDITVETDGAHGFLAADTVVIEGVLATATFAAYGYGWSYDWTFDGTYLINSVPAVDQFVITVTEPFGFQSFSDQFKQVGTSRVGVENPNGSKTDLRPTTNAYFAGRAWYAGTPSLDLGQAVYFSQIIEKNEQYGRCYQEADPTDPEVPDLIESDGGVIYIPEAGRVIKLQAFGPSMLVICDNGVWEIDGGGNRYFDAIDFSTRRVSEVGCISRESVIEADQSIIFASEQGAYRIFVDPEARVLVTQPITLDKVNTKWVSIDINHMRSIKTVYDPVLKRMFWWYGTSASPTAPTYNYTEALVYDVRLDAFYIYTVPPGTDFTVETHLKTAVRPSSYVRNGETIIKYLSYNADDDTMQWNEQTATDFTDFGELDAAGFFITGYENMGDISKDKQVKKMTTFMSRIDDSSLSFSARWDFAESSITGKFTPAQEAYRPPRAFLGTSGSSSADGYPVVFTKLDVPGQGLVLQARFDTAAGADAHIYGWAIDFLGVQNQ